MPSLSPSTAATPPQLPLPSVVWKDIEFDPSYGLHLRLYKPTTNPSRKLPVFFYFHGGGFCIGSCAWPVFHAYSLRLAADLPTLAVAPDYRLAPEHPLPAALHDAVNAVDWIWAQVASPSLDPFLADFGQVFVSSESTGGNLAQHLAVWFGLDLPLPNPIGGFVLLMPFFSGTLRMRSEVECLAERRPRSPNRSPPSTTSRAAREATGWRQRMVVRIAARQTMWRRSWARRGGDEADPFSSWKPIKNHLHGNEAPSSPATLPFILSLPTKAGRQRRSLLPYFRRHADMEVDELAMVELGEEGRRDVEHDDEHPLFPAHADMEA